MGQPTFGPIFELTQVAAAVRPFQGAATGTTVYTGTITGGAASASQPLGAYAGQAFVVSGFADQRNNGEFVCVQSSATQLYLLNPNGVAAVGGGSPPADIGTAQLQVGIGTPYQYAQKISNMASNNQGDNVFISPLAGDTLIAIAFGLKSLAPFDQLHGASTEFGYLQGINDFIPTPTISDNSTVTPESGIELELGVAAQFAVLAGSTITSAGIWTIVNGLVGLTPGTSITGTFVPASFQINTPLAIQAQANANTAYGYYKGLAAGPTVTQLSGMTLTPGTYTASSSLDLAASGNVNFDAGGNVNAQWVIQVGSTFTSNVNSTMTLLNGAQAGNIIFVCGASAILNGSVVFGTYIAGTGSVTLSQTGIATFTGRAISLTAAVTNAETSTTTNPPGSGGSVNDWVLVASIVLAGGDYAPIMSPPGSETQWQTCDWNLDGYYPCIYVWVCNSANAGTYAVNLNSVYQNGVVAPLDLAAGKPVFDGGINFQVLDVTGMTGVTVDGATTAITISNPAATSPIVTTGADAVFVVGLQKSANGIDLGTDSTLTGYTVAGSPAVVTEGGYYMISNGKLVGSEAHYLVEYGTQIGAGSWTPQFANPLGYETLEIAFALKHS
jgi:hypothetical protein